MFIFSPYGYSVVLPPFVEVILSPLGLGTFRETQLLFLFSIFYSVLLDVYLYAKTLLIIVVF